MTDRPIQLVLDTSAILDYCRGSLPVGELLVEVDAEGGAVALPLLCLVEAANANSSCPPASSVRNAAGQ